MSVYAEQVIRQILVDDSGVAALISTRVYPHDVPKGAALPAVVYTLEASEPLPHLGGRSTKVDEFELLCLDDSYGDAKALAEAVRSAVAFYSGDVTPSGSDTMTVQIVVHVRTDDIKLTPRDGSDSSPVAISVRVRMHSSVT